MKKYLLLLLMLSVFIVWGDGLGIFVDSNRFWGAANRNQYEINYSFPYHAVDFEKGEYGYEAEIFVDISIKQNGKQVTGDSFTNKLIVSDASRAFSEEEYLDKITLTLPLYTFDLEIEFTDVHTEKSYLWETTYLPLDMNKLASDIELSSYVKADTTDKLIKFHRGEELYLVNPSMTFRKELGTISWYQQFKNLFDDENGNYQLEQEILILQQDSPIDTIISSYTGKNSELVELKGELDISALDEGYYDLVFNYKDMVTGITDSVKDHVIIKKFRESTSRIFPELEDDIKLVSYFLNTNEKKVLKTLSESAKSNYISRFWKNKDPNPATERNEFMQEIQQRIKYADEHFSHFKRGWTSDMGRIYIKFGKPYEIRKMTTNLGEHEFSESSEYSYDERASAYYYNKYTVKNYEIWKYRMDKNANYIFFDVLTSGDYKLIYSSDDNDGENSLTDWRSYLGYDFDDRLLD